jgi:hypothetical protein
LITESLDRIMDQGRSLELWWRDDDAVAHTPALDRLLALANGTGMPLAIATIPARLEPSLVQCLAREENVAVLVHGFAHRNYASPDAKKAEFGPHRPLAAMADQAAQALRLLRERVGPRALDVFVPPWNRIAPDLATALPRLGFHGLSTFGPRPTEAPDGLAIVNTHLDPVDWRGSGGLVAAEAFGQMWRRAPLGDEPIGLLTHHLVADSAVWRFTEALLDFLAMHPAVTLAALAKLWLPASTRAPDSDARGGGTRWANA